MELTSSSIALYRIRAFAIPISTVTATATIILPILTGVSLRGAQRLASRSNGSLTSAKPSLSWTTMVVFILLTIYETAIATLALTHMAPPSSLNCQLDQQWSRLFSNKNAEVIRRIQDRYQCCGLHSTVDKAWPFPDRSHPVTACRDAFNRRNSCMGGWRRDEQIAAGLMLLVAVVVFLMKVSEMNFGVEPWPGGDVDIASDSCLLWQPRISCKKHCNVAFLQADPEGSSIEGSAAFPQCNPYPRLCLPTATWREIRSDLLLPARPRP